MNKKILFVSILTVFMLVAIAFASTVTSDTSKPAKKESPLYGIRTRRAIREKIGDFMRKFIGKRVFFLPFTWFFGEESLIRYMFRRAASSTICYIETCLTGCVFTTGCPTIHCGVCK